MKYVQGLAAIVALVMCVLVAPASARLGMTLLAAQDETVIQVRGGHGTGGHHGWHGNRGHHYGWYRGRGNWRHHH